MEKCLPFRKYNQDWKKALNSNLPFKQAARQFYMPWASPSLPFITQLADDLLGPLCIGYVRMKSDSFGRKITLSWTTGQHSFQTLITSFRICTYMYCPPTVARHCKWHPKSIHNQILHVCYSAEQSQVLIINDMLISGNQSSRW